VELGYRDFRYMREDHDLDSIRHDPRFRQLPQRRQMSVGRHPSTPDQT